MAVPDNGLIFMILAWTGFLLALWPLFFLMVPYRVQRRKMKEQGEEKKPLEGISVVVRCDSNPDGLIRVVNSFFSQNYEGAKEIIVACDPTTKNLKDTLLHLEYLHKEIYTTYVPEDTRNVSRRKLAIYLGVKAAKYDSVVIISSNTVINSANWLKSVAEMFEKGYRVVINPVKPLKTEGKGFMKILRKTDYTLGSLTWLSAALCGRCYRGDSNNIAYSKSLFLENKGFSKSLNLNYGDDDIFINEISRKTSCGVNVSSDGLCEVEYFTEDNWESEARRRMFTSKKLDVFDRLNVYMLSILCWAIIVLGTLGVIFGQSELGILIASGASILLSLIAITRIFQLSSRFVRTPFAWYQVIPSLLFRPILSVKRKIKTMGERDLNFTWKRLK